MFIAIPMAKPNTPFLLTIGQSINTHDTFMFTIAVSLDLTLLYFAMRLLMPVSPFPNAQL